tara:strand:+ start:274 stop:438 length:165 start_codon:yes stop_codon:yes gene_type:complete
MIKHYTIGYFDGQHKHQDTYVDAETSWEARYSALENHKYLHEHPNSIDYILVKD